MLWFKKKAVKKDIRVTIEESNAVSVLNEELERMHQLLHFAFENGQGKENLNIWWTNIQKLQAKLFELLDKQPNPDINKAIRELQEHAMENIIFKDEL